MFRCRECGEYFDRPRRYVDKLEFWGSYCEQVSEECPCCGSYDFADSDTVDSEEDDAIVEEIEDV